MAIVATCKRIRVLCLHGFCQNGEHFNKISTDLQRRLPSMEFICVSAPHRYKSKQRSFMWWNSTEIESNDDPSVKQFRYVGMEESLYFISDVIQARGPFDGVLGFSQGGIMLSTLLALTQNPLYARNELKLDATKWNMSPSSFKFAIIVSGFIPRDHRLTPLFDDVRDGKRSKLRAPMLHIVGKQETFAHAMRGLLPTYFGNYQSAMHEGAHIIPCDDLTIDAIDSFLKTFVFDGKQKNQTSKL